MVQRFLTTAQKRALQADLRQSASGPTRSQQIQQSAQQSAVDRGLDGVSLAFGAGSFGNTPTLPGELSGQEKLTKDKFMQAGGTRGTGHTSANDFMRDRISSSDLTSTPAGFEFLDRKPPTQGEGEDPVAFRMRTLTFERDQAIKQANMIATSTEQIRGAEELNQAKEREGFFQDKAGDSKLGQFKPVEIRNEQFDKLTQEERKINAQLPDNEQVKEFLTFDESQLTDEQRKAQAAGIAIRMSPEQERQLKGQAKAAAKGVTFTDPVSGKQVSSTVKDQLDRMREFLEADETDVLDVDADGNFILKDEEGEIVDPVQRAEDKLQKTVRREREQMQEQQKAQVDQIYSLHTMENGQLSSQGKRALDKLQNRQNRQTEAFEENVDNALDRTIRAEKKRQFAVEDRLNAIKANENDPLKQLEKRNKQEKADYINRERAKDPTQTVEFLVDKWNKINTYDAKGEKEKLLGAKVDSILDMNLGNADKFSRVYEAAGQDVAEAFSAFHSRFGEAIAKQMKQEFLEEKGWGEKQIKTLDYEQNITGFFTGEIKSPLELSAFIDQMDADNVSDRFKEDVLNSIATSLFADDDVKREAQAHLEEMADDPLKNIELMKDRFGNIVRVDRATGLPVAAGVAGAGPIAVDPLIATVAQQFRDKQITSGEIKTLHGEQGAEEIGREAARQERAEETRTGLTKKQRESGAQIGQINDLILDIQKDILADEKAFDGKTSGFNEAVGLGAQKIFNLGDVDFIQGTEAFDFNQKVEQLKNSMAEPNLQKLKGAMSDKDIEFIKNIATNINIGMTEKQFKTEMGKLEKIIKKNADEIGISPEDFGVFEKDGDSPAGESNRPQRNQNPGNLKIGGIGDQYAVKNANGSPQVDDQGHLIFPDAVAGMSALFDDVAAKIDGKSRHIEGVNPTLGALGKVYAEDPNWAKNVASILRTQFGITNVSPDSLTYDIDFASLVNAIATQEGFFQK